MKIVICTTPIRPVPTLYPPFGSMAIVQALRAAGYGPVFYHIDGLRPSFAEVVERLRRESPDILGISAVVSTAYGYVKKLCTAIREVLPEVKIVLGGNLAASAEILHRFCGVDVCVVGEGERIIVKLLDYYSRHPGAEDFSELKTIRGITYLNASGDMEFTGYESAIPADEFLDPDFSILEESLSVDRFIHDPFLRESFSQDPRSHEPHRVGKRMCTVVSTKGCVVRCTFCHRWDKGFRQIPPEKVIGRIRYLMDRYNVGFIQFGDENFGSDRKATEELIRLIKPLDLLWHVAGVRASTVNLDMLKRMHDAGCVALYYGFETGSPSLLKVMEKKLDLSHNIDAARNTHEAGLFTIYQLVLGMPGESPETLLETIEMVKQITEFLPNPPGKHLSINFIQALPGTPVYEYARAKGLIGPTMKEEETYLLQISDSNASEGSKFLNFTDHPYLTVKSWRRIILYEATVHWARSRRRRGSESSRPGPGQGNSRNYQNGGYFNLNDLMLSPSLLRALYPLRWLPIWIEVLVSEFRRSPKGVFLGRVWELVTWRFRKRRIFNDYRSLRRITEEVTQKSASATEESMAVLRLGR